MFELYHSTLFCVTAMIVKMINAVIGMFMNLVFKIGLHWELYRLPLCFFFIFVFDVLMSLMLCLFCVSDVTRYWVPWKHLD